MTFPLRNFELLHGALRSFASSPGVVRTFCPDCGSQITYATAERPDTIDLTTALFDEAAFPPDREIWLDHRLAWEPIDPTRLQCHAGGGE